MIDVIKNREKDELIGGVTIHFNTWKKSDGMKEAVFGKHLEAMMNNN